MSEHYIYTEAPYGPALTIQGIYGNDHWNVDPDVFKPIPYHSIVVSDEEKETIDLWLSLRGFSHVDFPRIFQQRRLGGWNVYVGHNKTHIWVNKTPVDIWNNSVDHGEKVFVELCIGKSVRKNSAFSANVRGVPRTIDDTRVLMIRRWVMVPPDDEFSSYLDNGDSTSTEPRSPTGSGDVPSIRIRDVLNLLPPRMQESQASAVRGNIPPRFVPRVVENEQNVQDVPEEAQDTTEESFDVINITE